ncbi:MAG TPA: TetR/AcrR family transcriptional regulator [Allosphingosinicella sp.]|jgi:AcrR family transcriptional regulator
MATHQDRRVRRTRSALIDAFNHLLLNRPRQKIRVADIIAQADVGRSTFYDHFSSAEDLHIEALTRPFAILADAAAGDGDVERLRHLLDHFWENRQRARATFSGRTGDKAVRLLADMVAARLQRRQIALVMPLRLAALQLAHAAMGPLAAWVGGEASCRSSTLAAGLCRGGELLVEALTATPVTLVPQARANSM